MDPRFDTWYSLDDGGYYAEFWDAPTGKDIFLDGKRLMTKVYRQRYQANKAAKRILRETDWTKATVPVWLLAPHPVEGRKEPQ